MNTTMLLLFAPATYTQPLRAVVQVVGRPDIAPVAHAASEMSIITKRVVLWARHDLHMERPHVLQARMSHKALDQIILAHGIGGDE